MTKFEFTAEEVQLNRRGILSDRQKQVQKAMSGGMRGSSRTGLWVILGFSVLGLCIIVPMNMQMLNEQNIQALGPQIFAGLCFAVFAIFAVAIFMFFNTRRVAAKIENAPVLSAEGVISHGSDYAPSAGFRSYYVYFGKKRFSFPDDMSRTFPEGATFRIYYCKVGQIELIMSFERIS